MRTDKRLPRMLHVLLHMERHEGPATSQLIANMLHTNPAVVRRTMAGLRNGGYVTATKGHGGGWVLARPLKNISLYDVYRALGMPSLFALGASSDAPSCLVEKVANAAINRALKSAEAQFVADLSNVTLAQLADDFDKRMAEHFGHGEHVHPH